MTQPIPISAEGEHAAATLAHRAQLPIQDGRKWSLQDAAAVGTLIGTAVAVVAILVGYVQYTSNLEYDRTKSAISLFSDYLKFRRELEAAAPKPQATPSDSTPSLSSNDASYVMHLAEAIYLLTKRDAGWQRTVVGIVQDNSLGIAGIDDWRCDAMDADFRAFLEATHKEGEGPEIRCDNKP